MIRRRVGCAPPAVRKLIVSSMHEVADRLLYHHGVKESARFRGVLAGRAYVEMERVVMEILRGDFGPVDRS